MLTLLEIYKKSKSTVPTNIFVVETTIFARLPSPQIATLTRRRVDFNSSSSPFEASKTTAPTNAGHLPFFIKNWLNITQDPTILEIVQGYQIQFHSPPIQKTVPRPSLQNCKLVSEEIEALLQKGAIKRVHFNDQAFYHRIFLVAKKGGGQRPVLDLSPLNKFVQTEHFKMENLMTIKSLINKGDYMINIDLTDAYLTVPIHQTSQKFISFLWQGTSYQFVTMPCCTESVYKIDEASNSLAARSGCSNDYFSRRYTRASPINRNIKPTHTYDYKSTGIIRVSDQLQKVNTNTHAEDPLLGDAHRLNNDGIYFAKGKIRKYSKRVSASFEDISAFHQANITGPGAPRIHSPSNLVRPFTLPSHSTCTDRVSTSDVRLQHTSEPLQKGKIGFDLVDNQSTIAGGKFHSASNCRSNNLIGCFQNRLGSILGDISDRRTVEYPRVPGSDKHPGTQGSLHCPEVVREGSDQQGDLSEDIQFDSSSLSEQQGRDPLPSVTAANIGDMELVRDKTPLSTSSTCSGKEQCCCARRIAQNEGPQRLENRFDSHQAIHQELPDRPLCFPPDSSAEPLRQLATRSGCDPCGCVHNELNELKCLCIPSIQFDPSGPSQNQEREGDISLDCPLMVGSNLVASVDRSSDSLPN